MTPRQNDLAAGALRAELLRIADQNNGVLNPKMVVDAAREEANPLHVHFEWDDTAAAEAYRLAQAHGLIRRVKLTITHLSKKTQELSMSLTRSFESRPSLRKADGGYERIDQILADDEKRHELVAQVLRDLQAFRRKFALLTELASVWEAIDNETIREGDVPLGEMSEGAPPPA